MAQELPRIAHAEAPGKVILFGEHFVVMGEPALAMAIDLQTEMSARARGDGAIRIRSDAANAAGIFTDDTFVPEGANPRTRQILEPLKVAAEESLSFIGKRGQGVDLVVSSKLPISVGLGSSASVAVATISAVTRLFDAELARSDIYELAFASERMIHGNPSGIDQTTATYGGLVLYSRCEGMRRLSVEANLSLVIGNTGIQRSSGPLIKKVAELRRRRKKYVDELAASSRRITFEALEALSSGRLKRVGELMDWNHQLLVKMGVSTPKLNHLVKAARKAGALGAKLTGAGGGGCMIALVTDESRASVVRELVRSGAEALPAVISRGGVQSRLETV